MIKHLVFLLAIISNGAYAEDIPWKITNTYAHSPTSFTQGLNYEQGLIYETTGLAGESRLLRYKLGAKPNELVRLPAPFFGEGSAVIGQQITWLTWHAGQSIVIDLKQSSVKPGFHYSTEGWGLDNNEAGNQLVMSDGSSKLVFRKLDGSITRSVNVVYKHHPITHLNELEWVGDIIYANQWQTPYIWKIDAHTGKALGRLNLQPLLSQNNADKDRTLNGIAYDKATNELLITGKLWSNLYRIKILK